MSGRYDDIISLPHPEPKRHRRMSRLDRAAQFAPFAALRGYEDVIEERRVAYSEKSEYLCEDIDEI